MCIYTFYIYIKEKNQVICLTWQSLSHGDLFPPGHERKYKQSKYHILTSLAVIRANTYLLFHWLSWCGQQTVIRFFIYTALLQWRNSVRKVGIGGLGKKKGILQLIVNKNGILSFQLNYFQLLGKIRSRFPMLVSAFNSSDRYAQIHVLFTCSWSTVLILLLGCPCYSLRYILGSSVCLHKYLVILC